MKGEENCHRRTVMEALKSCVLLCLKILTEKSPTCFLKKQMLNAVHYHILQLITSFYHWDFLQAAILSLLCLFSGWHLTSLGRKPDTGEL